MSTPDLFTRTHWFHPEWVAVFVAAEGWLLLGGVTVMDPAFVLGEPEQHGPLTALSHSAVMTMAMMAPLVLEQTNRLAVSSLWRRRYRAVAGYLVGYLGAWALVGAAMMLATGVLTAALGRPLTVAATFALALVSMSSIGHAYRLRQCWGSAPLALRGWRADRDCFVAGVRMAGACIAASWALMLAVSAQHGLLAMVAASALTYNERRSPPDRRHVRLTAMLGASCVIIAVVLG